MKSTLELVKQFCIYDFAERNCEKAVSLLARNICWFGTSDHEDVHSREEARRYLEDEIKKMPTPYGVSFSEDKALPTGDDGGLVFLRLRLSHDGITVSVRITASSCMEDGVEKIRSMHCSVADVCQKENEYFPVQEHKARLEREKEALVLSTMAGGLMGGYAEEGFPFYFINERMLEYLGYDDEAEFVSDIGGMIDNVMHPDDREMVNRVTREQMAQSGAYVVDYRMRKKDGSYIWVHDIGKLGEDENGKPVIVSVCYDISTEHEKQAQLDNLIDALPGGVALYRVDGDRLELLYQSSGLDALSGRTQEEYIQLIAHSAWDSIHPDDRDKVFSAVYRALQSDQVETLDYRVPHKSGGYVWISASFQRAGTENGCPILHAVFTEMPQQRALMTNITEYSDIAIVVTDQQTHELLYLNQTALDKAHLSGKDYTGKKCYEFLLGRSHPCAFCNEVNDGAVNNSAMTLYVPELDCHYLVQGHTEQWAGHTARIEYLTDITEDIQKKQRLDNIINAIPGGVAIYKISDIFETVYFSDGVPGLSGYTVEEYHELIHGDAAQMTHPDDREMVVRELKNACANRTTADFIFRKIHRDGHIVWVHLQGNRIGEEDGCPLIQCVFHNISAQKEQELLNQHLLSSMTGGVVIYEVINGVLTILQHSKGIAAFTGHTEEEFMAAWGDGFSLVYEPDLPMVHQSLEHLLASDAAVQTSLHLRHKDGHLLGVHMNARVVGYKDGHPLICAVFMKMSEESNMYQLIAQKSGDGIYIISKLTHELLYMNPQAKQLFQLGSNENIIGSPCYALFRQGQERCADCQVFETEHEGTPYELYIEQLNKWISGIPYSIDWAGIAAYVVYVSDITSRKMAVQEISNIYNNIPGAVFRCRFDADWTVLSANEGLFRFLGYTREEFAVMGNRMASVIYPDDLKIMTAKISAQLIHGSTTAENENRLICKDGTVKWISIKAQLLKNAQGEQYFYCVFVDISKQKKDEQRRLATERNLTTAVTHMGISYWEITDFAKRTIHVSNVIQKQFGIDTYCNNYPDDFLSLGFVAEEHREIYRQSVLRIYQGEEYVQFDARIKTLNSDYVWMRLRMTRIEDAGVPPRAVCTAEGLAEYKDLELRVGIIMKQNSISTWRYDPKRTLLKPSQAGYWAKNLPIFQREFSPAELEPYLHPEDVEIWRDFHAPLALDTQERQAKVRVHIDPNSPYRQIRCRYTIIADREGTPAYALGSFVDITEQETQRERYENAMRNRYRALDSNVVLIGHCNITQDTLLEMEDRTGMDLQARFGTLRDGFFRGLGTLIPNKEQREAFYAASLSGPLTEDFALGITQHEVSFMGYSGTENQEPCWFRLHINTVEHPETRDLMGFLTVTNITQSKQQEQMLESVARRNYDYVAYVNLREDSMTLYYQRELQGKENTYLSGQTYRLSAIIQNTAQQFIVPEERALYLELAAPEQLLQQLQSRDSYEFSFSLMEDGVRRVKRVRINILDRATGVVVMTRSDITEAFAQQEQQKKQLSEALEIAESANRHKTDFLASMSHDIRTPMNAIIGMCALALKNEEDSAQIHESLQIINNASQILLSLINNVLDMNRIESGKMVLQGTPFSLLEQIHKTADSCRVLAQQKKQTFQLYTNILHDNCHDDASRIHSAIGNVLSNAIKYTPEGGNISYRVSELTSDKPDIGLYRFEISDNGIGISEENQQHIFESFYRGLQEKNGTIQGTGLGLAITKQIVELKGGTISLKSAVGIGTTFVIDLPISLSSKVVMPVRQSSVSKVEHDFSGIHVLLCEDHPVNQKVVMRILEKAHVRVTLAVNGKEGYETFFKSAPDTYQIIFMDIRMPVMDGYESASAIRSCSHPQAKSIPIIALSANAFSEDVRKSLQYGMNAHIAKPVVPERLYEAIENYGSVLSSGNRCKQKVLFVDDVEINIAVLAANLQNEYEVFIARNGTEALNTLEQNPDIAAIITDLMMPEIDGITLIKTIRANDCYNHVAVLANTQYGGIEQEKALRGIGADDFIYKPTNPDIVAMRLKAALKQRAGQ